MIWHLLHGKQKSKLISQFLRKKYRSRAGLEPATFSSHDYQLSNCRKKLIINIFVRPKQELSTTFNSTTIPRYRGKI